MSRTGTIVVVVAIAAILYFVVLNSGPQKVTPTKPSGTSTYGGLFALGSAVVNAFGGKPQAPSSLGSSQYYGQGDSIGQAGYGLSHGVVEQEGNQLIDLNTGNALIFGAE